MRPLLHNRKSGFFLVLRYFFTTTDKGKEICLYQTRPLEREAKEAEGISRALGPAQRLPCGEVEVGLGSTGASAAGKVIVVAGAIEGIGISGEKSWEIALGGNPDLPEGDEGRLDKLIKNRGRPQGKGHKILGALTWSRLRSITGYRESGHLREGGHECIGA